MLLFKLFIAFFKIGAFTFGGGYAMIPIIEKEVVDKNHWLTKEEFIDMLAVVQSLPGPIAINSSVYIGYKIAKLWGSIVCALGAALPSFIIILFLAIVFTDIQDNPTIEKVFKGIRPAVVALIVVPVIFMAKTAKITWKTVWIPVAVAVVVAFLGLSPAYIIVITAILGILFSFTRKDK
jgi:chromate transporter